MTVNIGVLTTSVLTLFIFMMPGFLVRKTKLADERFPKAVSVLVLYVAQVALLLYSFLRDFDLVVFQRLCLVFAFSIVSHSLFYGLSFLLFKKAPDQKRRVLRFGVIFSNAGYMGIPLIRDVFGDEYAIYASVYIVVFNIFAFSVGRLIYTGDKSYISAKKMIVNPAVIPILIGLVFFFTPLNRYVPAIIMNVLNILQNMVAPLSMIVIGAGLADIDMKGIFKDKYTLPFLAVRMLIFPAVYWAILRICTLVGILDMQAMQILLILSATPAAAVTTIFAELYGGDAPYASKLVALSTLCTIGTMPLVALLLHI